MLRQIDRRGGHVVLKRSTPSGKVEYLAGLREGDAGLLQRFDTLGVPSMLEGGLPEMASAL